MLMLMAKRSRSLLFDYKFIALLVLVAIILVTGATVYSRLEGWRFLDAFYFSTITLTTVGYGDFSPQTDAGKLFTIFYLLFGIGVLLAFIAVIADHAIKNYSRIAGTYLTRNETPSSRRKR
jgi:voltage-gated potassium channel Kch